MWPAPRWDRTIHKISESLKQQLYEQKRRPVDDLLFIPHNFFFYCFLSSPQSEKLAELMYSVSLPQFLFPIFGRSLPHSPSPWEDFGLKQFSDVSVTSFQCSFFLCGPPLRHSRHQCAAAALYLHKVYFWQKKQQLDFHSLLLQGFYRRRLNEFFGCYISAIWLWYKSQMKEGHYFTTWLYSEAPASCLCVMHLLTALQQGSSSL